MKPLFESWSGQTTSEIEDACRQDSNTTEGTKTALNISVFKDTPGLSLNVER